MRSSAPNERSSGSGPDGVGDTTLFAATAASFASDGPTLPIVGGLEERAGMTRPSPITGDSRPSKKQKTFDGLAKEVDPATAAPKEPQIDLAPLYKPWTLLPAELLPQIEKRLGGSWEENTEVVVWTKNQNVKSGINRLKALLGFTAADGPDGKNNATSIKNSGKLIAVSASGQGTTKMIGIVEMAKRIVGGKGDAKEAKEASGETWYAYTGLTGLKMPAQQEKGNEAQEQNAGKKVPVLTVWFSRNSIPEFKKAFGEQTFTVVHHASDT
ncbi:hypothetical protein GRF29_8g2100215 [Pseudopithomyces chartarum]|uniref:Uncharacterized protein n=1 Tax=Pseudopithomyces chartarum TaxID=1892770 RepID=A0AAN6M6H6_9PLEO|nr:hypothetical protein GRF29_8g2100215 [Pseudopithomyces chartarum]